MSQLAQARLSLLSQKSSLPLAVWRHDLYLSSANRSPQAPYSSPLLTSPSTASQTSEISKIKSQPNQAENSYLLDRDHVGNNQTYKQPAKVLCQGCRQTQLSSLNIISFGQPLSRFRTNVLSDRSLMDTEQRNNSETLLNCNWKLDKLGTFKQFRESTWFRPPRKNFNTGLVYHLLQHKNRHKSFHESGGLGDFKYFAAGLGLLGFMTKPSESAENEDSKLTDEQKMKKMSPAELLIAKGVLSLCDHDHDKANMLFHQALELAISEHNVDQETMVLNLLATNFLEGGDFEKAEKLLIDLIKRLVTQEVEETDSAIIELSLKLASIYSKNEKTHAKADTGFRFVINNLRKKLEDLPIYDLDQLKLDELSENQRNDLALLGWAYEWFAKHLMAINDFSNAIALLKMALDISTKVLGLQHEQTLILLNDIGTTLAMSSSPEEGKNFITKAVEGALESQSRELASFYVNLGLVNLQLQNLAEARRYCEYSIELALKNHDHHNTTQVIKLSKDCLEQIKRLVEVENS